MAKQLSMEEYAYVSRRHITKKEKFLDLMDEIVPWEELSSLVSPYYYKNRTGRKPFELETMLRLYLLRDWYRMNDSQIEDAVYDSFAMRRFLRLDFTREKVPDASTLAKFRKLLARYKLTSQINAIVTSSIEDKRYRLKKSRVTELSLHKKPVRK